MGELHIEIIHDRIRREHGIETHLGPLQVAYRETILHEASASGTNTFHLLHLEEQFSSASRSSRQILFYEFGADTLDRTVGERRHVVTVELAVRPVDIASAGGSCELAFTEELEGQLSAETKEAVENGVHSSFLQGKWTKLIFSLFQGNTQSTGTSLILVKFFFKLYAVYLLQFPPLNCNNSFIQVHC